MLRHALHNNVMNETTTKIFPYLERLLDGEEVEWKTLGEVCDRTKGTKITATQMKAMHKSNAPVKIFAGGQTFALVDYNDLPQNDIYFFPSIIVKSRGIIEFEYYDKPFSHKSEMWSYHTNSPDVNAKFLYYYLKTREDYFQQLGSVMQMPQISIPTTEKFPIPIPPLRVQVRIVEILDKFTQLEAELEKELEAELEARKKQYAYYRNQLLNFSQCPPLNVNIEWKTLGEVMEIVTDFTAAGSFASNAQNVRYLQEPNYALLVRTTDIKQGFKSTEKFIYVDQHAFEYLWRVNLDKECIILPNVGNCGEVYHSSPTILPYKNCVLGPNAILVRSEKASNKFLYYLFQAEYFQQELAKITSNAGQGKFNKTNLKQIKLPIPPLSEQRRIVDILDRFDTLTNSISEGLPKEIALRRKQYEYYRDALLNFPRAEVTA